MWGIETVELWYTWRAFYARRVALRIMSATQRINVYALRWPKLDEHLTMNDLDSDRPVPMRCMRRIDEI